MTLAVAHSNTEHGQAALRAAAAEAILRGEKLAVLHVVPGVVDPDFLPESLEEHLHAELDTHPGLEWELHTQAEGHSTAGALVDLALEVDASLLVVGSRRRSAVGKLLLGSTVQRVLLEAPMPVLVVKAVDAGS